MTDHNPINDWYVEWACTLDSAGSDSTEARDRLQYANILAGLRDTMLAGIGAAQQIDAYKKHIFYGKELSLDALYSDTLGLTKPGAWERMDNHETIRLLHSILGLFDEAGELMQALFEHVYFDKPLDATNLREEYGDTLWYLALGARFFGQDTFAFFMLGNYGKLTARYPDAVWTQQHALNRDKDAEMKAQEGTNG